MHSLYPYKFHSILKEKLWGGTRLSPQSPNDMLIGEDWKISDRENDQSHIENGPLAGISLHDLVLELGESLLGNAQPLMGKFPLLFKLIETQDMLSLQVHPTDKVAQRNEKDPGKTEMWYVLEADKDAKIYCGLTPEANQNNFSSAIKDGNPLPFLREYNAKKGDVFYLPAGTVHAMGPGLLIVEIQENSDLTYRLSDWGRVDINGKARPLHIEKGLQVINWDSADHYISTSNHNHTSELVNCPYFQVQLQTIDETSTFKIEQNSFEVWTIIEGKGELHSGQTVPCKQGDFILLPAQLGEIKITPSSSMKILRTRV